MTRITLIRIAFCAAAVVSAGAAWLAVTTYYSRYYVVRATRGLMEPRRHVAYLERALAYDGSSGYANLLMAHVTSRSGRGEEALRLQERGMKAYRPVRAYLQEGSLYEKLNQPEKARRSYETALLVAPRQVAAMERLAVLAYQRGDLQAVEDLAAAIARIDLNNMNPVYLRAIAAEKRGEPALAYLRYQRLSAAGTPPRNALYRLDEVHARLEALRPRVEGR